MAVIDSRWIDNSLHLASRATASWTATRVDPVEALRAEWARAA